MAHEKDSVKIVVIDAVGGAVLIGAVLGAALAAFVDPRGACKRVNRGVRRRRVASRATRAKVTASEGGSNGVRSSSTTSGDTEPQATGKRDGDVGGAGRAAKPHAVTDV